MSMEFYLMNLGNTINMGGLVFFLPAAEVRSTWVYLVSFPNPLALESEAENLTRYTLLLMNKYFLSSSICLMQSLVGTMTNGLL